MSAEERMLAAEAYARCAGRLLEAELDPEWQRLGRVFLRLAHRIAVDSGRLERVA